MRTVLVRIQTPQPLFPSCVLPDEQSPGKLVNDDGEAGFGPISPAAVHGDDVAVAHFLKIVRGERGAVASAAVENHGCFLVWDGFFDVALDDAFTQVNGAG